VPELAHLRIFILRYTDVLIIIINMLCTSHFVDDIMFSHYGPNTDTGILAWSLQRSELFTCLVALLSCSLGAKLLSPIALLFLDVLFSAMVLCGRFYCLQCFDAVGRAAGKAYGL